MQFCTTDKKAISVILAFFLFYFFFGLLVFQTTGKISNSPDFLFHFQKATGQTQKEYSPGFYYLFAFIPLNEFLFWTINLFLVFVLIPFIIYKITETVWSAGIYFCGISFAWETMFAATFPSALVAALFLYYLLMRKTEQKWFFLFSLGVLAAFVHSFGATLFFTIGAAEFLALLKQKAVFLGATTTIPARVFVFDWATAFYSLIFFLPLPTLYFGLKKIDFFGAILCVFSFYGALTNYRALMIAQLLFCIFSAKAIQEQKLKTKIAFFCFLLTNFFLYFFSFGIGVLQLIKGF